MKRRLTSVAAGFATLVATGGIVFAGAGVASATTYTFEPDPTSVGTLTFYDANGHVITGGTLPSDTTTQQPFAAYVVGSTNVHSTDTRATLFYATPDPGPTAAWATESVNGVTTFSPALSGLPVPLAGSTKPIWKGSATDNTLYQWSDPSDGVANTQSGANANIYQIRMYTNNPSPAGSTYDSADVLVDRTAHTWTQVYPTLTGTTTALTQASGPATPQNPPASPITLHAAVTPATVPGTVTFLDGATVIETDPVVAGAVTSSSITPALGTHNYTARFDPTPGYTDGAVGTTTATATLNEYKDSTSSALSYSVIPPADATSVAAGATHGATTGDPVSATAAVTDTTVPATAVNSGQVQFSYSVDGGAFANVGSPVTVDATGHAALNNFSVSPGSGGGPYTYVVKASYLGTLGSFAPSNGSAPSFTLTAPATSPVCTDELTNGSDTGTQPNTGTPGTPASCTDTQTITATIPEGILTITTPYSATHPFNLGTLALTGDSHEYTSGPKPFGNATDGYIRITDTRSGGPFPWTANAQASNLTSGAHVINAQNVGLTGMSVASTLDASNHTVSGFDANAANLAFSTNPAAEPAVLPAPGSAGLGGGIPHQFAHANSGIGTVDLNGDLTLNAPTSTAAGLYTGTITFTVG